MASSLQQQSKKVSNLLFYKKEGGRGSQTGLSGQASPTSMKLSSNVYIPVTALLISTVLYVCFQLVSLCGIGPVSVHVTLPSGPKNPVSAAVPEVPRGVVQPLLFRQNLSHSALHSTPFGLHLASLFEPRTVAIAGVEFGADMGNFAKAGYRVHAVEPGERFLKSLRERIAANPDWDVELHPFAATNESNGTLVIEYQSKVVAKGIPTRRLDDLVHERVALLSADVQGGELEILQGASGLMPHKVDSVLVEIAACKPKVRTLLELLDRDYTLFDFVPWGYHRDAARANVHELSSYGLDNARPNRIADYYAWLCRMKERFVWIQTDVFAVRRDLVPAIWSELARIGDTQCARDGVSCHLRDLLAVQNGSPRTRR